MSNHIRTRLGITENTRHVDVLWLIRDVVFLTKVNVKPELLSSRLGSIRFKKLSVGNHDLVLDLGRTILTSRNRKLQHHVRKMTCVDSVARTSSLRSDSPRERIKYDPYVSSYAYVSSKSVGSPHHDES